MNVKIKSKKDFNGCTFREHNARKFEKGKVYEVTVDIDEELALVAIKEGWAVRDYTDDPEEVFEKKLIATPENKLIITSDNKAKKTRVSKRKKVK